MWIHFLLLIRKNQLEIMEVIPLLIYLFYAAIGISIFQILLGVFICFFKRKIFGTRVGFFTLLELAFLVDTLMMLFNCVAIVTSYVNVTRTLLNGMLVVIIVLFLIHMVTTKRYKLYVAIVKSGNPNYDRPSWVVIHEGYDPQVVYKWLRWFAAFYEFVIRLFYFCYAMAFL